MFALVILGLVGFLVGAALALLIWSPNLVWQAQHAWPQFEFAGTLRDNVLLGRPESTEEELAQALQIAQAAFVYDLPDGLDTAVGERGEQLSAGERQLVVADRARLQRGHVRRRDRHVADPRRRDVRGNL